jgi:hypothetical protein
LPPNTKIRFEFEKSDDKFLVMRQTGDFENYKVKILNLCLHVPVAQMSEQVFNEIKSVLASKETGNEIAIHYRRSEIRKTLLFNLIKISFYKVIIII